MLRLFIIGLLLIYFWYVFEIGITFPLSKPTSPNPIIPQGRTFHHRLEVNGNNLSFIVDSVGTWNVSLPNSVQFLNNHLTFRDVCHQQPDGAFIAATGSTLYEYVQQDRLQPLDPFDFESNTHTMLREGNSFYFVCQGGVISTLKQCPPGRLFRDGRCAKIDVCTGKDEGVLLPDPFDNTAYYECGGPGTDSVRRFCPFNHWFMHDACRPKTDHLYYCRFFREPLRISDTRYMRCRHGTPTYYSCPPNTRLFDTFECESDACADKQDGQLIPSKLKTNKPFLYYPGYKECQNQKVAKRVICPQAWDHSLAREENLTHLPMVFDGTQCSVPRLCENVTYNSTATVVPSFEFSRRAGNWKHAQLYDSLSGYNCPNFDFKSRKRRVVADPGQMIDLKRFKMVSACTPQTKAVPVADHWNKYYDCVAQEEKQCPPGEIFDGIDSCRKAISNAHQLNGYPLFRFDNLDPHTGWIKSFNYSNKKKILSCSDPDTELNTTYNICIHRDCKAFPFLSQLGNASIKLKEGYSECLFDHKTNTIIKTDFPERINFWTQRILPELTEASDDCIPGTKIQSGNFVLDASIYTTCRDDQPFVFCPSPHTTRIESLENTFACMPPISAIVDARKQIQFQKNEIFRILPANTGYEDANWVIINKTAPQPLGVDGINIPENELFSVSSNGKINILYHYRNTHPPHIAFKDGGLVNYQSEPSAFLLKRKDNTKLPIDFPTFNVEESVSDFLSD